MKKHIIKIALVLSAAILTIACNNDDDATGAATISATSPSLSVTLDFADSQSLVEQEAAYGFTVTLSEPQIVDVRVYLTQISGTASLDADYSMPSNVTIPAGKTSASDVITLHADDLIEETETAVIQIGTGLEANVANVSSQTISFSIMNLVEGDLAIGMSWDTSVQITDNFGNEIDAYDAADLRLLITDVPYTQIFDGADGGSAESYKLDGAGVPDGEYYVVADFYSATDIAVDLDLTLTFDQVGVINGQTHNFSSALNTLDACADAYFILAKITKTGNSYSFEEVGEKSDLDVNLFVGTYTELSDTNPNDWLTEDISISIGDEPNELIVAGIYEGLFDYWGEVFQPGFGNEGLVSIFLNADGSITLPDQYAGQTLPGPYDYYYNGSGSFNLCDKTITLSFAMQFDDTYSDDYQKSTIVIQLD